MQPGYATVTGPLSGQAAKKTFQEVEDQCGNCFVHKKDLRMLLPCSHMPICIDCLKTASRTQQHLRCYNCRQPVTETISALLLRRLYTSPASLLCLLYTRVVWECGVASLLYMGMMEGLLGPSSGVPVHGNGPHYWNNPPSAQFGVGLGSPSTSTTAADRSVKRPSSARSMGGKGKRPGDEGEPASGPFDYS
ncbi:uncharacterized protein LOC127748688 isoform X1 [Frankliniella occidentalis]|uniref:Uncharacterized protein LOC127748688 isoform X1 n=1 Tax=Frankliniella occidentalis TaxID=133901 RepID=A0A9C6X9Q2_FRAOC|nr:uncharacterized protein LOC127748688 isoform X1 [Frankliniella occidentalis]